MFLVLNVEEGIDLTRLRLAAELSWGADSDIKLDGKTDLDLSDWLIVVPTRHASRRLREALAVHAATKDAAVLPMA